MYIKLKGCPCKENIYIVGIPYILKAYSTLTLFGAFSLKTDIISKKSSNVRLPSLEDEKTLHILSLNGLTYRKKANNVERDGYSFNLPIAVLLHTYTYPQFW